MRLQILRTIASVELGQQIDRGTDLVHKLGKVGSVKSQEDFEKALDSHVRWSKEVLSLLHDYFEGGDDLIAQWQSLRVGLIDEDQSRLQNMKGLVENAKRGIEWLTNLRNRLDEFPQSPKTPVPS